VRLIKKKIYVAGRRGWWWCWPAAVPQCRRAAGGLSMQFARYGIGMVEPYLSVPNPASPTVVGKDSQQRAVGSPPFLRFTPYRLRPSPFALDPFSGTGEGKERKRKERKGTEKKFWEWRHGSLSIVASWTIRNIKRRGSC